MATIRVKRSTGSTAPTGLTFGEPAFVNGINSFYVTDNTGTSIRVGAQVDASTSLGTSDNKIPTQNAVKTYIDSNIAGGAVSTLNGLTGAVFIGAGTAISLAVAAKGITVTNTGVQSIAGTSNQITASGSTGAVTLSLPSSLTVPGSLSVTTDLTVTGNLTVNGTTTTVNSDVMTVDDPLIIIGTSGGVPISVSDGGKDRGIAFNYFSVSGKTGFFGWDASASQFIFAGDASVASDVATVNSFSPVQASSVKLYNAVNGVNGILTPTTLASDRTYTLPDHTGTVVAPSDLGTSGYILKANGTTSQPTWVAQSTLAVGSAATLTTARTIGITGDISGSASFNGSADINITATIEPNSVALGTDTTGNYVATVAVSGIGLSVSGSGSESAAVTITSGATSANSVSQIVARDSSGNFSAGTITAALSGNASTATALANARTIGLTGDVSGSASFDGTANINITATIAADSVALGTDTTGNYVATLSTSSTGLSVANSGSESAAVTVNFSTITSGLNMGTFTFATGEFSNSSGTVSLGTVDGGTF